MAFGVDDAIGAGVSVISGLFGKSEQEKAMEAAIAAYQESVADLEAIGVPSVEAQQIVMERYKTAGDWTPELEDAVKLGDSSMLGVSTDPQYKEAQIKSLSKLSDIADSGGMTLTDKAELERTMGDINAAERGSREAITQRAAQQGGYGSGTALAAQLMNQQGSAARATQAGLDTAGRAEERALNAIISGGELGGKLRSQEFAEKQAIASAADEISKWNAANAQDTATRNANLKNEAMKYNLGNKQNISNANTDVSNKEETYNKGLIQQKFGNELDIAKAKASARAGQAQAQTAAGNSAAQMWAGIGSGINQAITSGGGQKPTAQQGTAPQVAKATLPKVPNYEEEFWKAHA